jgi:Putative Flp pilus-assembly TadE/G-like
MHVSVRISRVRTGERGAIVVMVALWLPVLLVCMTFVVDVGNWFVHKRHLQTQADAAVLAAAQEFKFPCSDAPILQKTDEYSGSTYNAQIGGTPPSRVHRLINSKTFYNQPSPADDTVTGTPCTAGAIDVKLTETDLPWYFKPVAGLLGGSSPVVPFINAQARISVNQLETTAGALPVGVPDVNPKSAHAWFIDEDSGAVLGTTALSRVGTSNGLVVWDNAGAPVSVKVDSANVHVGVVVALGGASSTTCGQPLVQCFDAGVATAAGGLPSRGIVHIRGYSNAGSGAQPSNDPILRDVTLVPGTCADPYFSSAVASCTFGVRATVDFGALDPVAAVGARVTATVGGTNFNLAYDSATARWQSATTIPLAAGAGPAPVTMDWAETKGTLKTNTCSTSGGNKCKGSFGTVQRAFSAADARSGPIKAAQVWENGTQWANSVERCSAVQASCTHDMVVRIGVTGNLANASSVSDPVVSLRVVGGSQNQSLDCDPSVSQLRDELSQGCAPTYKRNDGSAACPGGASALWNTAQPWACVAIQTGSATNQVAAGMNQRILGLAKPLACTSPNNWSQFPSLPRGDKRLIQVFLTPYGSFSGSGSTTVPVTDFATFYVTGWTGQGSGFDNPCQGNGDDPVPNNDAGYIVGHFIKYIQTLNTGGGTTACDVSAFGSCVAVMTR